MKQIPFVETEHAGKIKQLRKELLLIEMGPVVQWKELMALIEPNYPKGSVSTPCRQQKRNERTNLSVEQKYE